MEPLWPDSASVNPSAAPELLAASRPEAGDTAPDFVLPDEQGRPVRLSDFRGRRIILYFYPKDDTPGCTLEACNFRDELEEFERRGAAIVGVSTDSVESHRQFKARYRLNFPLLSDADRTVVRRYGVWREKNLFGLVFRSTERTTFVIDEAGRILRVFRQVRVADHIEEILSVLGLPGQTRA